MKKLNVLLLFLLLTIIVKSQSTSISCKTSTDEIDQISTWHYLLGLNDCSSLFFYADKHRSKIFMKRYDKEVKLELQKEIWELISKKEGKVEVSGIYEINNSVIIFMSFSTRVDIKFFKLIINPKTGEKISEEEILNYEGLTRSHLTLGNYFFNITKCDSLETYYLTTFVRINDNTNELKILGYSYNHKLISTFSKNIEKKYSDLVQLSSIQLNKAYYFAINYIQESNSPGRVSQNEQEAIIYKYNNNTLQVLPLVIEKSFTSGSVISGQFSVTQDKQLKFIVCNTYSLGKDADYDKPLTTDITVLNLSKDALKVNDKYEISQKKLLTAYKNTNSVDEKSKIYLFNIPVSFTVNADNQDELIFQSFRSNIRGNYVDHKTEDIGIFRFDKTGNIISFDHVPYKSQGHYLHALGNNVYAKGNTSQYYEGSPYPGFFFNITSIVHKQHTFIFLNNVTKNLYVSDNTQIKEFNNFKKISGMVLISKKMSTIGTPEDNIRFDFSSSSFNEKTGIFYVISQNDSEKTHISYITFN
jgi:hypothetical protein